MEFEKKKIALLEYDLLSSFTHIFQGTFLRHGGTSEKNFLSLNVSDQVGDNIDCVKRNREIIKNEIGSSKLVIAKQVHGKKVFKVTNDNYLKIPEADALYTKEKDLALVATHADCQVAIFYDPKNDIVAVAHAGWKGLVQNIYKEVMETLVKNEKANASDICVCISPSIGPCHAEFVNYKTELPKEFWGYKTDNDHFNLFEIAKSQLMDCGIKDKNIEISKTCTFCDAENYFSYRRDKITGRHATVVCIKK